MESKEQWNPAQYKKFEKERNQPFYDLLKLIQVQPKMDIIDLGCGTGQLTRILHESFAPQKTLGIDNSVAMLKEAFAIEAPNLSFEKRCIGTFKAHEKYDLIFSNAALQWVPDHHGLLKTLKSYLQPNGQLAIQMPANFDYPTHVYAQEIASYCPFKEFLRDKNPPSVLKIHDYAEILHELGFKEQHVRAQIYPHQLNSSQDLLEWVKGSLLTFYQSHLPADHYEKFYALYQSKLLSHFGDITPLFLPFKRILIWAQ